MPETDAFLAPKNRGSPVYDENQIEHPRTSADQKSKLSKSSIVTRSKTREMATSARSPSVTPSHCSSLWRTSSGRTRTSGRSGSSIGSAKTGKAIVETRIRSQKNIEAIKQQQMHQRLLLEEEHLRKKREAEEEELGRKREAEEKEFSLIRVREKQELHFQQQLEHAHLQAELNEAEAELSTEFSNIELANQTKTNNNILSKNGVNDKATNNHSAGDASLNALECVKVKRDASHFKTEHNAVSDSYAKAQVNENESLNARFNVKVSQSISVPVSCAANKAVIDVKESCYNATSSLKPYSKPFESKTLCACNGFVEQ